MNSLTDKLNTNILEKLDATTVGDLVIKATIALFVVGLAIGLIAVAYYWAMSRKFKNGKAEGKFASKSLNDIIENFKKSAGSGTDNINTEVIIENNLNKYINAVEEWLKIFPPFATAFGLLGTFLGLTFSIASTSNIIGNGISNITTFTSGMQKPIAGMATAFWTSIVGLIISLALNIVNVSLRNIKNQFYGMLEDYLDNEVYASSAKNFNSLFDDFNTLMKDSMLNLTNEMKVLFKDGVEELVNKINGYSLDLGKSAEGLKSYTKDLQRLVSNLDKAVTNFTEPVDTFKTSINDFTVVSDDLSQNFNDSLGKFIDKVDNLENKFNSLSLIIEKNKEATQEIGNTLQAQSGNLQQSYKSLVEGLNEIKAASSKQNEEFGVQVKNLTSGYSKYELGLTLFIDNMNQLHQEMTRGTVSSIQNGLDTMSKDIVKDIEGTLKGVKNVLEELARLNSTFGSMIKANNEWQAESTVKKAYKEIDTFKFIEESRSELNDESKNQDI